MATSIEHLLPNNPDRTEEGAPFEYRLLTGHYRTDDTYKTAEQLRMQYLQLSDELIHKMTDGVPMLNEKTGELENKVPDTVIFLDKSARPVSWMVREMWETYAADQDGNVPKQPDIRYLNIDREQWVNTVDPEGVGSMNIDKVDEGVIRSLRSIFVSNKDKTAGLTSTIDTAPSLLDGKAVLIVDEVFSSGRTLDIAKRFIKRAFPDTQVAGTYWMRGITAKNRGLATGNADLPVWYQEKSELGRGIGNRLRDPSDSSSKNLTQRLGRWFLSERLKSHDESSLQLRKELRQLAHHPDVPFRPSLNREDSDYDERLSRLNHTSPQLAQASIRRVLENN